MNIRRCNIIVTESTDGKFTAAAFDSGSEAENHFSEQLKAKGTRRVAFFRGRMPYLVKDAGGNIDAPVVADTVNVGGASARRPESPVIPTQSPSPSDSPESPAPAPRKNKKH